MPLNSQQSEFQKQKKKEKVIEIKIVFAFLKRGCLLGHTDLGI